MAIGLPGYELRYIRYLKNMFCWHSNLTVTFVEKRVYLTPIEVPVRMSVDRVIVPFTTPVAGNIRAGIYRDNGNTPQDGALIVESASVAKAGTNQKQEIVIAETQLEPGLYWLATLSDESTTVAYRSAGNFTVRGSVLAYYYDLGVYGLMTNPCPVVTDVSSLPIAFLRVAVVYQPPVP